MALTLSETIRLKGLDKYAKERIKQHGRGEHGDEFFLGIRRSDRVLVWSKEKSWTLKPGVKDLWGGWLVFGKEVEEIK